MSTLPSAHSYPGSHARLESISYARKRMLLEQQTVGASGLAPWVERSWQRCISYGLQPSHSAIFTALSIQHMRRTAEGNAHLVHIAKPILEQLGRAIANTRYFAILTIADGVVVDVSGAIDRSDPRADLITRIGTDLSERSMGTTAISTALAEHQPVWLHRGEHFFSNTTHYSCAGAPLIGPDGVCQGMLDVTGIDAMERPELKHLVAQTARKIENALVLARTHYLTLRLNWPGSPLGSDADGLLCLDKDGWIQGANSNARQMVPLFNLNGTTAVHFSEVLGVPQDLLFDAARQNRHFLEVPLWSGLVFHAWATVRQSDDTLQPMVVGSPRHGVLPLKDLETALILKAVDEARGNIAKAAQTLGISRATVYRKLARKG